MSSIPWWYYSFFKIFFLSEKLSDFHEILYTAADFELDERHVIKNEKVALDRLRVRQNVFFCFLIILLYYWVANPGYMACPQLGPSYPAC